MIDIQAEVGVTVRAMRDTYLREGHAKSATEINAGLCGHFAEDVREALEEQGITQAEDVSVACFLQVDDDCDFQAGRPLDRVLLGSHWPNVIPPQSLSWDDLDRLSADAGFDNGTHVWLTDNALHYDAECPDGVANFFDLPFFQRVIASWQIEVKKPASGASLEGM